MSSLLAHLADPAWHVTPHWAKVYWTLWGLITIPAFLAVEIWALVNNVYATLSWTLWNLEDFIPGQGITHWSAAHLLIGAMLFVLLAWLIAHLVFGVWT